MDAWERKRVPVSGPNSTFRIRPEVGRVSFYENGVAEIWKASFFFGGSGEDFASSATGSIREEFGESFGEGRSEEFASSATRTHLWVS